MGWRGVMLASACIVALTSPGAAAGARFVPGDFAVKGKILAKGAGADLSVHRSPQAVALEGCRTDAARVRSARRGVRLSASLRCGKRKVTITADVRGDVLRGVARTGKQRRRFTAKRRRPDGVRLSGSRSKRALTAIGRVSRYLPHPPAVVSTVDGRSVARTQLILFLAPKATVAQVNALLARLGAGITLSRPGSPMVAIAIPDPGSARNLASLLRSVRRLPGVAHAYVSEMAEPQDLPPGADATDATQRGRLSHLLASRTAAAFNSRAAIRTGQEPAVVVDDKFGGVMLPAALDAAHALCADLVDNDVDGRIDARDGSCANNPAVENAEEDRFSPHGYHVSGIIHGDFANDRANSAGLVTGAFPARGRSFVTIDEIRATGADARAAAIDALRTIPGRVVFNTSLGQPRIGAEEARRKGAEWAQQITAAGLTGRVLHATAAGNQGGSTLEHTLWAAAALREDLVHVASNGASVPVPRLTNTLVVENATESSDATSLRCLLRSSNHGGNLAAPGTDVWSFNVDGTGRNDTGTSMASPLVAGLAAYLWSIAPDLSPQQIMAAMTLNPQPAVAGCRPAAAPALDAYQAVLSLDLPGPPAPSAYPVRMAILDVDPTVPGFNDKDLEVLAPAVSVSAAASRTWSRLDLNGNGITGGGDPAQFDLDRSGSVRAGATSFATSVADLRMDEYDETRLTDADILCYYANSSLYTGLPDRRDTLLADVCLRVTISPASKTLAGGATQQFGATVHGSADQAVQWSATAGSITQGGLYTAPQTPGTYTVTARSAANPSRKAVATVEVIDPSIAIVSRRSEALTTARARVDSAFINGTNCAGHTPDPEFKTNPADGSAVVTSLEPWTPGAYAVANQAASPTPGCTNSVSTNANLTTSHLLSAPGDPMSASFSASSDAGYATQGGFNVHGFGHASSLMKLELRPQRTSSLTCTATITTLPDDHGTSVFLYDKSKPGTNLGLIDVSTSSSFTVSLSAGTDYVLQFQFGNLANSSSNQRHASISSSCQE